MKKTTTKAKLDKGDFSSFMNKRQTESIPRD